MINECIVNNRPGVLKMATGTKAPAVLFRGRDAVGTNVWMRLALQIIPIFAASFGMVWVLADVRGGSPSEQKAMVQVPVVPAMPALPATTETAWSFKDGDEAYQRGDFLTALQILRPLAEQSEVAAQYNLGLMYDHGQGVPQDHAEAARWYRMAGDQGHADAEYNLGRDYYSGTGVAKDYGEAAKCFRKAADRGNADAQYYLRVMAASGLSPAKIDGEASEGLGAQTGSNSSAAASARKTQPPCSSIVSWPAWENCQSEITFSNGTRYVGQLRNKKFNGQGVMTFSNGQTYIGEFADGKLTGQGTLITSDGTKYIGKFRDGKLDGQGTISFPNGQTYVGELRHGKVTGRGTLTTRSGEQYDGQFRDGKLNGQATEHLADGSTGRSGLWSNNVFVGASGTRTIARQLFMLSLPR